MPKHLEGSAFALDQAIGPYRAALANLLGCSADTLDLWTTPPPGFTPQAARNRGRRNPLDELYAIAKHCPQGLDAVRFLANALGHDLVAKPDQPHDGKLLATPAVLMAAVETFCRETNRRRLKLIADQVDDLADEIIDAVHALKLRFRERAGR